MSSYYLLLQKVHEKVHDSTMKLNYSEPKIYTGGVDINSWSKLSFKEKKDALSKSWYVHYSYRNPTTGRLKRQPNIKGGANRYRDRKSRYHILSILKESLEYVLSEGYNPYEDNSSLAEFIEKKLLNKNKEVKTTKTVVKEIQPSKKTEIIKTIYPIEKAFKLVLKIKLQVQSKNSYSNFNSRINRFEKWLKNEKIDSKEDINSITKKTVIQYLNSVLHSSSARNRNNTRLDLSSLFQTLVDNEIIQRNFVSEINVLKATPERNKTYTNTQQEDIFKYLKQSNEILYLFVQFVSYNYLRPVEVCRLKIKDIDLTDKKLYVRAKNKPVKIKIIPDILIKQLPDLTKLDKDDFLFTPEVIGGKWDTIENNKRNYFSKQFKKVKDHFGLGKDYGLYSFRHTFITKLYKEMAKTATPLEVKSKLQLITGHADMKALEMYLRDIDAVLPDDYSNLLK
ncbi:site-specific integrase [Polaribacter sp. Z014]|nr:site-specific integrase [Polaribacter sp. Z014]MCL7765032.1 site-specific integrase [Polaribacter sp. Z014]